LERIEDQTLGFSHSHSSEAGPDGFHSALVNRPMNMSGIAGGLLCIQNGCQRVQEMKRYGPGVEAVMANYRKMKDPRAKQRTLANLRSLENASRAMKDNPLGGAVPFVCSFDKPPPTLLTRSSSVPTQLSANSSIPDSSNGLVFSTEVDIPAPNVIGNLPSETSASLPPSPEALDGYEYEEISDEEKSHLQSQEIRSKEDRRKRRTVNAFRRVVKSRSFVILTDDNDVRNVLKKTFLSLKAELLFVKTAMELLHALSDLRQNHHVFMLDLAKPDLNVDGLLRTIRRTPRYQSAPVIAISMSRNLPELVKSTCSYVIFKPASPEIVREATVWCLDRGVLESHFQQEGTLGAEEISKPEEQKEKQNDDSASGNDSKPESRQSAMSKVSNEIDKALGIVEQRNSLSRESAGRLQTPIEGPKPPAIEEEAQEEGRQEQKLQADVSVTEANPEEG